MRRTRGATLIEMLFAVVLTSIVIGSATVVYGQAMTKTGDGVAMTDLAIEAELIGTRMDDLISCAVSATVVTVNGQTALRLRMPALAQAPDSLGFQTQYNADYIHPRLGPTYLNGNYIWFFALPDNSNYAVARTTTTSNPTLANVDWNYTFLDPATRLRPRYPLPGRFSFVVDPVQQTVSVTLNLVAASSQQNSFGGINPGSRNLVVTRVSRYKGNAP